MRPIGAAGATARCSIVRETARDRRTCRYPRWEALGVVFIALVPHRVDAAVGRIPSARPAGSGTDTRRHSLCQWVWAGVFLGMAVTPQQSALLVLAPLFVIAPGRARWRLLASAAGTALIVSLPFVIANSGSARRTRHAEELRACAGQRSRRTRSRGTFSESQPTAARQTLGLASKLCPGSYAAS